MAVVQSLSKSRGEKVAVLLNANAKRVNENLRRHLVRHLPDQAVYYSRSLDDAKAIVSDVMDRGYTTLLTGGGDGTFVGYVNEILTRIEDTQLEEGVVGRDGSARKVYRMRARAPKFGVLKLGTGNSLAGLSGSSSGAVGVVEDILRVRSGDVHNTRQLHLIDGGGKLGPFAGCGVDAKVLNDYAGLRDTIGRTPFKALATGGPGYFMSIAGKSVPQLLLQRGLPNVKIINTGSTAHQVGPDGRNVGRGFAAGETLYEGPCRIAAVGTVPCYGYGFTLFPHALRTPGKMQLRVTAMSVVEILGHLPQIWKGRTPSSAILDFEVDKVRMEFDRDVPYQIGGDAEGYRRNLDLSVDPRAIDLLDFRAQA